MRQGVVRRSGLHAELVGSIIEEGSFVFCVLVVRGGWWSGGLFWKTGSGN